MKKIAIALLALCACSAASAFTTDTITVATHLLAQPGKATVITPDNGGDASRRFPTVYLLNGYGGDHRSWLSTQPRLGELADKYGMVFVLPDGRNTWYWDSPVNDKSQMETFITTELVPYVDSHYPTRTDASQRAITGLSMGGHGALWLATRHPDIWKNAGSMSGGVDIRPFVGKWQINKLLGKTYGQDKDLWDNHTVAQLIPQMKDAGLNMTIDCGNDDFFARVNDKLHQDLIHANVPHDYTKRPGNHSHTYWANSILYHLVFFDEAFKANAKK